MGQAGGKKGEVQIYFQCILLYALNTRKNIFFDNLKGSYCFAYLCVYTNLFSFFHPLEIQENLSLE